MHIIEIYTSIFGNMSTNILSDTQTEVTVINPLS